MLQLYNSYSKKIEPFKTLEKKKVKAYVCGITPYDTTHVGHAFTYVVFDVLFRFLTYSGYTVNYTQNVTDIDDDILKRASQEKRDWQELGDYWTNKFLFDMEALRVNRPTHYVKATEYIPTIIEFASSLIESKNAYEKGGNVYFDVKTFPAYGSLSHFSKEEMIKLSKERGGNPVDPNKKNPLDFILWQKSRPEDDQPLAENEPSWDSPWGKGRPGWHIECSAMIYATLGVRIDIHGGGHDLIFPHHESEIAQSECFTRRSPFVNYWMHTAMVMYQGKKMSKSLGNLIMISDLLKTYSPQTIKLYLISHHYRKTWEFLQEELNEYEVLWKNLEPIVRNKNAGNALIPSEFETFLQNDLDTESAVEYFKNEARVIINDNKIETSRISSFLKMCEIFGLL